MAANSFANKRKHIRFPSDANTFAWITVLGPQGEPEGPAVAGLAVDESHGGCSIVLRTSDVFKAGRRCLLVLGQFDPAEGDILWVRQLEPDVVRIGVQLDLAKSP